MEVITMLRKIKPYLAIILALIMCVSSVIAVSAAEMNEKDALVSHDENNPVTAAIAKILRVPIGTNIPSVQFNFIATPISYDEETNLTGINMPDLKNLMVKFPHDNMVVGDPVDGIVSIVLETGNIFENVDFLNPGIYVYEIKEEIENIENDGILNDHNQWLYYSDAIYTLTIHVSNNAAGDGTFVSGLGTKTEIMNEEGQLIDVKVDPTPGGGSGFDHSQMIFINDYVKANGPEEEIDNPDPTKVATLSASKTVSGALGNLNAYFEFAIKLNSPSIHQDTPGYYRAYILHNGTVIHPEHNAQSDLISKRDDADHYYIKISTTGETTFTLKDGQQLVFVDTPVGTTYNLTERGFDNHIPSFIITSNNVAGISVGGTAGQDHSTGNQLVGELLNRADFTNNRERVTPTGLLLNNLPFVMMIVLGIGGLVTYVVVKTKKIYR
jgi:hypothetical protein